MANRNPEEINSLFGKAVAHESASGDQSLTTRNTLVLESQHPLATNKTVDLALDPVNAKVVADGPQYDARGVETIECLVDNMMQQVDNANKRIESDVETNSIALMNAKSTGGGVELVHESNWVVVTKKKSPSIGIGSPISNTVQQVVDNQTMNLGAREIVPQEEKQGATSTLRWIDIADKEEKQVTSPPMQKKLSPTAPAFVPSSANSNIEKLASLAPININKQLQVGGSFTLSPNKFANLDDEDISEEGEEGEEEEMLDYCFAIAARNADISPRQQRNNKTKHERKHSWDGKVTKEFVPWHLLMRLAKQNHMTVATTSTRSNKAKK
uniref:NB-ARC domain containing protein n=1 Tax=Solanum tuberosum TaxID=4113 RepID=M1AAX2_SOLTU